MLEPMLTDDDMVLQALNSWGLCTSEAPPGFVHDNDDLGEDVVGSERGDMDYPSSELLPCRYWNILALSSFSLSLLQ